jgi:peptidoglycan/LPS O-acetylase OafA/YrhL
VRQRANCFDLLRLFAALSVAVHHATLLLGATFLWHSADDPWWFMDGVPLFFIMSGLLVYRSAEKCHTAGRRWMEFYRNRALRIAPALYAYLVILVPVLLIVGSLSPGEMSSARFAAFTVSVLALIPVYTPSILHDFGSGTVNGSLWTIPVEVSFYVIAPALVLAAVQWGRRQVLTAVAVLSLGGVVLYAATGAQSATSLPIRLFGVTFLPFLWYFTLGIFWSHLWRRTVQSSWIAAGCAIAYGVLAWARHGHDAGPAALYTAVAALPLSYVAMWVGHHGPQRLARIPAQIGDLSFGTYIWHLIVVGVLLEAGARSWRIPGTALVLVVVLAALALAAASWWLVERPALRMKRYTSRASEDQPVRPVADHPESLVLREGHGGATVDVSARGAYGGASRVDVLDDVLPAYKGGIRTRGRERDRD